jgi:hypothetical protein
VIERGMAERKRTQRNELREWLREYEDEDAVAR